MASYILETNNLKLTLEPEYFSDSDSYLINTKIECYDYCGMANLDVSCSDFAEFIENIKTMFKTLKGNAILKEQFGQSMYISFSIQATGIIKVQGSIYDSKNGHENKLFFENELEPSSLNSFLDKLVEDFRVNF